MGISGSIAWARLIAIAAIIAFHRNPEAVPYGFAGVIVFVAISIGLLPQKKIEYSEFVYSKFMRILLPWTIAALAYGLIKAAYVVHLHRPLSEEFNANMLLYGTSIHLWFLPYLFVALVLIVPLVSYLRDKKLLGLIISVGATVAAAYILPLFGEAKPFIQWIGALPGVGFGIAYLSVRNEKKRSLWIGILVLSQFACCAVLYYLLKDAVLIGPVVYGVAGLFFVWIFARLPAPKWLIYASERVFVVYLIHPLFLKVLAGIANDWLCVAMAFGLSFVSAIILDYLSKIRAKRSAFAALRSA